MEEFKEVEEKYRVGAKIQWFYDYLRVMEEDFKDWQKDEKDEEEKEKYDRIISNISEISDEYATLFEVFLNMRHLR